MRSGVDFVEYLFIPFFSAKWVESFYLIKYLFIPIGIFHTQYSPVQLRWERSIFSHLNEHLHNKYKRFQNYNF